VGLSLIQILKQRKRYNFAKTRSEVDNLEIVLKDYEKPVETLGKIILEAEDPVKIIRTLAPSDYFQLVKTGDEGLGLMLLESGSPEQWQYVLDLELWNRDRLDLSQASRWLNRLAQTAPRPLVQWLLEEGEDLARFYLSRLIEVVVIEEPQEAKDLPEGFFSLDGHFYLRIKDSANREDGLVDILRTLAVEDYEKYQSLLLELESVIPAEEEEALYRLRNVRLAEYGFLPYEEALAVYAPLEPAALETVEALDSLPERDRQGFTGSIPLLPIAQPRTRNLFLETAARTEDPWLLGKLRLEFAGLANQIISADHFNAIEMEDLVRVFNQAARLINLAIEKTGPQELGTVEAFLRSHPLVDLFRVGFGLVQKLKWEAERWQKGSWSHCQGFGPAFWGEPRGKILTGLLEKRPAYYAGTREEEAYRDFEKLSELRESLETLQDLMVLDGLLEKMAAACSPSVSQPLSPETTFEGLLFTFWARLRLGLSPSFAGLSLEEAERFLFGLQGPSDRPTFIGDQFQAVFIRDLATLTARPEPVAASLLEQTLGRIWREFQDEYARVAPKNVDSRYSRFLCITPS
jgi:hypothetical protein